MQVDALIAALLELSPDVRYVAVHPGHGEPILRQRSSVKNASASESDRYEELLVNPTVLELTRRRGEIDCGGLEYILIRYGAFFQLILPLARGHISVAVEPDADPLSLIPAVCDRAVAHGAALPVARRAD